MHKITKALIKESMRKDNRYYRSRTRKLVKAFLNRSKSNG